MTADFTGKIVFDAGMCMRNEHNTKKRNDGIAEKQSLFFVIPSFGNRHIPAVAMGGTEPVYRRS